MKSVDYQAWALSKDRNYGLMRLYGQDIQLVHGALGAVGEAGELSEIVKKHLMYNKPLDKAHVKEEVGDILWYLCLILDSISSSFEECMALNRVKLDKRYPRGFNERAAKARRDKKVQKMR